MTGSVAMADSGRRRSSWRRWEQWTAFVLEPTVGPPPALGGTRLPKACPFHRRATAAAASKGAMAGSLSVL